MAELLIVGLILLYFSIERGVDVAALSVIYARDTRCRAGAHEIRRADVLSRFECSRPPV